MLRDLSQRWRLWFSAVICWQWVTSPLSCLLKCNRTPCTLSLALTLWPLTPPARSFSCHPDLPWNQRALWERGSTPASNDLHQGITNRFSIRGWKLENTHTTKHTRRLPKRGPDRNRTATCFKETHVTYSWNSKYNEEKLFLKWSFVEPKVKKAQINSITMQFAIYSNIYFTKNSQRPLLFLYWRIIYYLAIDGCDFHPFIFRHIYTVLGIVFQYALGEKIDAIYKWLFLWICTYFSCIVEFLLL